MSWGIKQFDQLYHSYHRPVYKNILKYIRDEALAQDILQEVFVSLWEHKNQLEDVEKVPGWLFVVSSNKSISYLRSHIRRGVLIVSTQLEQMEVPDENPDLITQHVIDHQWDILEKAIEALPERRRQVFRMCRLEGKTYKDVATVLGISVDSVKEYVKISNKSIKTYIDQNYHPEMNLQILWLIVLLGFLNP